jgi:hypothetical protein
MSEPGKDQPLTEQEVRERAYDMWERRGRQHGQDVDDWLSAERQLKKMSSQAVDESSRQSFPASDPPATRRPDEPPANAADKWIDAGKTPPQSLAEDPDGGSRDTASRAGARRRGSVRGRSSTDQR